MWLPGPSKNGIFNIKWNCWHDHFTARSIINFSGNHQSKSWLCRQGNGYPYSLTQQVQVWSFIVRWRLCYNQKMLRQVLLYTIEVLCKIRQNAWNKLWPFLARKPDTTDDEIQTYILVYMKPLGLKNLLICEFQVSKNRTFNSNIFNSFVRKMTVG